jgi:hypothetical protein
VCFGGGASHNFTAKRFSGALDTFDNSWFPNRYSKSQNCYPETRICYQPNGNLPFVLRIGRRGLTAESEATSFMVTGGDNNSARIGIYKVLYNLDGILV